MTNQSIYRYYLHEMKEKFLNFFNNFNFSDLIGFISAMDIFGYILNWKTIAAVILLAVVSLFERSRAIVLSFIFYTAVMLYILLVMIVLKNSDVSEPSVFIFMLSHLVGGIGLGVYRYLMK
ncbi:MAG: hypothetical protein HY097_00800 [Nitrospinae bacterium]|nr:hypothetical protein [Nitrospinota bacterium]MBI3813286.1 hypothetical protein [Nitrospinota bacterium]